MRLSMKQRGAVLAMAVAALAMPVAQRFFGPKLRRFPYATSSLSPEQSKALIAQPQWEHFSVTAADGVSLNGLLRRPSHQTAPWIVFCSGNDPTPLATAQRFLERVRDGRDWGIATWAYRGTDSSGGKPSPEALTLDADLVLDQLLAREQLTPERVHLVAFSLGGYLAAHLAGRAAAAQEPLASLTLLASVEHIAMTSAGFLQRFVVGDVYDTRPLLDAVPAPVLVVQGGADEALGPEQGRAIAARLAARLGKRARYLELPGVQHNPLLTTEAAISAVRAFIEAR